MKRLDPEELGDVLRRTIEEQNMTSRLLETRACALFPVIVGKPLAEMCGTPVIKAGIMYVPVANASLRSDLMMNRSRLVEIINTTVRQDVVDDIRFTA